MNDNFNLDKLIRVKVFKPCEDSSYAYKKAKKIFGITLRKEGIYWVAGLGKEFVPKNNLPNHYIENGIVYEKARCVLFFQDDHIKRFCFDSYEEAISKSKEFIDDGKKWLKCED